MEIRVAGIGANDLGEARRMVEEKAAAVAKVAKTTLTKATKKPVSGAAKAE